MTTFHLAQRKITIPLFNDLELKHYFENGYLRIEFIDDVVVLGANLIKFPNLARLKNTIQIDGCSLSEKRRVLIEVAEFCRNEFVIEELKEWSWSISTVLYDKSEDKFSKSLCRTLFYDGKKGRLNDVEANSLISEYCKLTYEADLTPEHNYKLERYLAHDIYLKGVPDKLDRDKYIEVAKNIGFYPLSDSRVCEVARNFHNFPHSVEYMPADKIAQLTVNLRRAETILRMRAKNYNKPRNPLDVIAKKSAECYFCKTKGFFGSPPFTSFMSQLWQSQVCDNCLGSK